MTTEELWLAMSFSFALGVALAIVAVFCVFAWFDRHNHH